MSESQQTFSKTPSVLTFSRRLTVTDGAFFNLKNGEYKQYPLWVFRHGIRGTQNVSSRDDTDKGATRNVTNIQQTDTAKTDFDAEGFVVEFSLRMLDLASGLEACASEDEKNTTRFAASIHDFIARAKNSDGAKDVCYRLARNIANGSWLWRNRVSAESLTIKITDDKTLVANFDALSVPLDHFNDFSENEIKLGDILHAGLTGDNGKSITVTAFVSFGVTGSFEVFPSQAYLESKPKGFARPLYKMAGTLTPRKAHNENMETLKIMGQAGLRDQKISNRIKKVDTWYAGDDHGAVVRPIPVEPKGAVLDEMKFYRNDKHKHAYSLFARLNQLDPNTNDGKFCIAIIIRGAVLSESDKNKSGESDKRVKNKVAQQDQDSMLQPDTEDTEL